MKLITINRTFESCIISWNKAQIKKMDLYKNRRNADFQFCFRQKMVITIILKFKILI